MCYVNSTCMTHRMVGWISDPDTLLTPHQYCDADFAGSKTDMRSTSGVFLALKAFSHTATYDTAIAEWLQQQLCEGRTAVLL